MLFAVDSIKEICFIFMAFWCDN